MPTSRSMIAVFMLLLTAGILPLLFAVWNGEAGEAAFTYVLAALSFLGLGAWFWSMGRGFRLEKPLVALPVLAFAAAVLVSSWFSLDRWHSLFGAGLELFALAGFFLLAVNCATSRKTLELLLTSLIFSMTGGIAIGAFLLFGPWEFDLSADALSALAALLAVLLFARQVPRAASMLWLKLAALAGAFSLLLFIDSQPAWLVLASGLLVLVFLRLANRVAAGIPFALSMFWLQVVFLLAAVAALLSPSIIPGALGSQAIVSWQGQFTFQNLLAGSGPGTAGGGMSAAEKILAEIGLTGTLPAAALFLLVATGGLFLFARSLKTRDQAAALDLLPQLALLPALLAAMVVLPWNPVFVFLLWFFLAMAAAAMPKRSFAARRGNSLARGAGILFLAVAVSSLFWGVRAVRAEMLESRVAAGSVALSRSISLLEEAAALRPWEAELRARIAELYLERGLRELKAPESMRDTEGIGRDMRAAVEQAQNAARIAPSNPAVWRVAGRVYKEIRTVPGAVQWGIEAYERALELDPRNLAALTELADLLADQGLEEQARGYLEQALLFKPGDVQASLQLALVKENLGQKQEALELAEFLAQEHPSNPAVLFELGRMLYNRGMDGRATAAFRKSLELDPTSSNARYALALALERQGLREQALQQFELVLQVNPDNEEVAAKVNKLREAP